MATQLPPVLPPLSDAAPARPSLVSRPAIASLRLRLRAWWLSRRGTGAHPLADRIARGDWAALDRLLDDLDGDWPPSQPR